MTLDTSNALTLESAADQLATLAMEEAETDGQPAAGAESETEAQEGADKAPLEAEAEGDTEAEAESEGQDKSDDTKGKSKSDNQQPDIETVEVTLKDGTKTTVKELARSFYREADYTRDKQRLAQRERELDAFASEKLQRLDNVIEAVSILNGKEPDADADPIGYAEWAKREKLVSSARKERDSLVQRQFQQAREQALQELVSGRVFEDWKDPDTLNKGLNALQAYALAEGFKPEELMQVADIRFYKTMEKARRWDESQKATTKLVKAVGVKPAAAKPGPKAQAQGVKEKAIETLGRRFAQTRSTADAIEYLTRLAP